jgi:hypothetical protein
MWTPMCEGHCPHRHFQNLALGRDYGMIRLTRGHRRIKQITAWDKLKKSCAYAFGRIFCPSQGHSVYGPANIPGFYRRGDRMGSAGLVIAALLIFALGAAAGASFFLYQRKQNGDTAVRLFAPRLRRLAFVERAALDGGRKLLLVRRDDVEHLVLVGGPIDLVVETGIRSAGAPGVSIKEEGSVSAGEPFPAAPSVWPLADSAPAAESVGPAEPRLPPSPHVEEEEDVTLLTAAQEAKAAE